MGKQNRIRENKPKLERPHKVSPMQLTCITLSHYRTQFVALIDSGSNCSIVDKSLLDRLNLTKDIVYETQPVRAFTGDISQFIGYIWMDFSIGSRQFRHKFQIQEELRTNTDCLLGSEFLSFAQVTLNYSKDGRELLVQGHRIPIVEQQKRICKKTNTLRVTYTVQEDARPVRKIAKSCENRRIDPGTSMVIKTTLLGGNYPAQIIAESSDIQKGFLVETQLLTTRYHDPPRWAKCKSQCTKDKCLDFCPTAHYWFSYILIYNPTNRPVYVQPGQGVAEIECQYENEKLTTAVNAAIQTYWLQLETNAGRVAEKIAELSKKKTNQTKNTKWVEAVSRQQQHLETNFLHLDPIKNKSEYRDRYNSKHRPALKLEERKQRVKDMLDKEFSDMNEDARELLLKYPEVVALPGVKFVGSKALKHRICYNGPVFFNRQYKTPHVLQQHIQQEIDEMLKQELIGPSESDFNNALLPVCKTCPITKKVKIRLVLDLRSVNRYIEIDRLPINDVQNLLSKMHGCKFLSVVDLKKGYNQIDLTEDSQKFTAFRFDNRTYSYKKLCFGLASAPASFIKTMNIVTSGMSNVFVYMDDLLIFTNTLEEHIQTLDTLYKRLSFHGLEISVDKCSFFRKSVEYLGFDLSTDGIKPLPKLLRPMLEAELPSTLKEARALCSLFSFYRRFLRNYSTVADPLINLTRDQPTTKGDRIKVHPDEKCREALEKLKNMLRQDVCLKFPNFGANFVISSDASNVGLGAALSQRDKKGHLRPIAFASRSLNKAERRYPAVELEALGIVYALK